MISAAMCLQGVFVRSNAGQVQPPTICVPFSLYHVWYTSYRPCTLAV